jgi:lysophospholipase L1-like esterase
MNPFKISLGLALGALLALLTIELCLQALPVSTATRMGYHIDPFVRTYPPRSRFVSSVDWDLRSAVTQSINSVGFASSAERNRSKPGLALIGDSFVEGTGVAESLRLSERLRALTTALDPVMLGSPGTSLIDYVDRARWASRTLEVSNFVFFVSANDANEAVCGSGQHLRRCLNAKTLAIDVMTTSARTRIVDALGHSASLQYFLGHLKMTPSALLRALFPENTKQAPSAKPPGALRSPASAVAIEHFLEDLKALQPMSVMIFLDCDRASMYDGKPLRSPETYGTLHALNAKYKIPVIDSCPRFQDHFKRTGLRTEVSLTDTHWNARGHAIVAELVAEEWAKHYPKP